MLKNKNEKQGEQKDSSLLSDYAIEVVPKEKRSTLFSLAAVWFGFTVSISAFLTGGTLGSGLTATQGIGAVLIGNLVLMFIASLIGIIGAKTGLTTYSMGRMIFGEKGSVISSTVLGVLGMALIGVLMDSFGNSMVALLPGIPKIVFILIFAVAITSSAIFGYKGLKIVSWIAMPSLWILIGLALFKAVPYSGGWANIFNGQPDNPITMATAISLVISTWANGACLSSDISRYAQKPSHVIIGSGVGFILGTSLFEIAAVLTTIGTSNPDFTGMLKELGLLVPGVIITLLALWTTTDNNVYSSSLAFLNMGDLVGINIPKWGWTIICVLIAVIASTFGLASNFSVWLGYLGSATTPFAGILITHFWILNRDNKRLEIPKGFRYSALITWAICFILTRIVVMNQTAIPIPSSICGIMSGCIVYIIMSNFLDKDMEMEDVKYFEY